MSLAIAIVMLLGYLLICSEHITRVNKATVAIFCGVVGWVLFIIMGPDYVQRLHAADFSDFLAGASFSVEAVNQFIAENLFAHYLSQISSIVLYLLATMAIVELLFNNECFEFIATWCRSRSTQRVVWTLVTFSFLLSTNLDNLTASVVMLLILRQLVINPRQRMYLGSIIVIATNCGGCFTVIGDVSSLLIWSRGAVTPGSYSGALFLPAIVATVIPTALIARKFPENIDLKRPSIFYRGENFLLPKWQRSLMLVVGMGGLWFVPTFHRLTGLPPFLGALCVLGVLWVVNEIINHKRMQTEQPVSISGGRTLQYEVLQMIMFFIGIALCVAILAEIGAMHKLQVWCDDNIHNTYIMSLVLGAVSSVMDNIALVLSGVSIYPVMESTAQMSDYMQSFTLNGEYWNLIALSGCVGGCLLPIGNTAGYALMKSEDVSILWYLHHITLKVLIGWLSSLGVYFLMEYFVR